jgi:hypothetical protein
MKAHIEVEGAGIYRCVHASASQQRRECGCEAKLSVPLGDVQRLDPETIASKNEASAVTFPNPEGDMP